MTETQASIPMLTCAPTCMAADICAFGPRDYANEVRLTAPEMHNKPAAPAATSQRQPRRAHTDKETEFQLDDTLR